MENPKNQVESYVPAAAFYEGKREVDCKIFQNRFAVVDAENDFSVLACRGANLEIGSRLVLSEASLAFLHRHLAGNRVLVAVDGGSAVFFGDCMWQGIVPVLLLEDDVFELSAAARLLFRNDLLFPETAGGIPGNRKMGDLCRRFSESLASCDRIFDDRQPDRFRRHAARVAEFAGCRADFGALPVESFPLCEQDYKKWTVLLLCLFLSLRGIQQKEPCVFLKEEGSQNVLGGANFFPQAKKRQGDNRFLFLQHPSFADVDLQFGSEGIRFSVPLAKKPKGTDLHALSYSTTWYQFSIKIA